MRSLKSSRKAKGIFTLATFVVETHEIMLESFTTSSDACITSTKVAEASIHFCVLRDLRNNIVAVTGSFVRKFASVNEP